MAGFELGDGGAEGSGEFVVGGYCFADGWGEGVVGVGSDGQWGGGPGEGVRTTLSLRSAQRRMPIVGACRSWARRLSSTQAT